MKLTTKSHYAVMAMIDMVQHGKPNCPSGLSDIAARQGLPIPYLEQLFVQLRRHGLIQSFRGQGGGYCLAHPADAIPILRVIDAVGEDVRVTRCQGKGTSCIPHHHARCQAHRLWARLEAQMRHYLENISLADVASGKLSLPQGSNAEPLIA